MCGCTGLKTDFINVGDRLIIYTRNIDIQPETSGERRIMPRGKQGFYIDHKRVTSWTAAHKLSTASAENFLKEEYISNKFLNPYNKPRVLVKK